SVDDPGKQTYVWGKGYGNDRVFDYTERERTETTFFQVFPAPPGLVDCSEAGALNGTEGDCAFKLETVDYTTNISRGLLADGLTPSNLERIALSTGGYMLRVRQSAETETEVAATGETLLIAGRVYLEFADGTRLWMPGTTDPGLQYLDISAYGDPFSGDI